MAKHKAVFLDRDGVINIDKGYVGPIEDFTFCEGVKEALALIKSKGFLTILCTNQSGIARGRYTVADFLRTTSYMQQCLQLHASAFDAVYFCPHHPQAQVEKYRCECSCRKPLPGMFSQAVHDFDIDTGRSIAVGDRVRDLLGPQSIGVKDLILISPEELEIKQAPFAKIYNNLLDFAKAL